MLPAGAPPAPRRQEPTQPDPAIAGFLAARERLQQREQELAAEIAEIRRLLSGALDAPPESPVMPPPPVPPSPTPVRPRRANSGLRQAVTDLIQKHGPLTKDQLVDLLTQQNFPFFGKPKPALDPVLYSKKFVRNGKLFSLKPEN